MRRTTIILFILLSISIHAQFTAVQTKLIDPGGAMSGAGGRSNIFTAFTNPADNGVGLYLPSAFDVLAGQENVVDGRILNGAIVEANANVTPLQQGNQLTSKVSFYAYFKDVFDEACQVIVHTKILYEVCNDGAVVADLHYGINPNIRYLEAGNFSSIQGYSIKLRKSDASGVDGEIIYNSGEVRANMNNNIRGTAYANVPAGATRYILFDLWVSAFSLHQSAATIFSVDGSQGIAVGFDDEVIAVNEGLNNDPFIDVKAKLKFQLHNLFADQMTDLLWVIQEHLLLQNSIGFKMFQMHTELQRTRHY